LGEREQVLSSFGGRGLPGLQEDKEVKDLPLHGFRRGLNLLDKCPGQGLQSFIDTIHLPKTYQNHAAFANGIFAIGSPLTISSEFGLTLPLLLNSSPPVSFMLAGE
jgi:hypothetical protein